MGNPIMEFAWGTDETDPVLREQAFWEDVAVQMKAYAEVNPELAKLMEDHVVLMTASIANITDGSGRRQVVIAALVIPGM